MIKVYCKNYCPFCTKAKNLLSSLDIKFEEVDITDTPEVAEDLVKKSGIMTVPQIFVDDEFVGDCSAIHRFHEEGVLLEKLKLQ